MSEKCLVLSVGSVLAVFVLPCFRQLTREMSHHSITLPYNDVVCALYGFDVGGEILVNLFCAVPADEGHFSRNAVGVEDYVRGF